MVAWFVSLRKFHHSTTTKAIPSQTFQLWSVQHYFKTYPLDTLKPTVLIIPKLTRSKSS